MKWEYFCICYRVHFTIYSKDTIISQQKIGEFFFLFHLIHKSIKVSQNNLLCLLLKEFGTDVRSPLRTKYQQPFIRYKVSIKK